MSVLVLPPEIQREICERLNALPRPKHRVGKVVFQVEINCRPDGTIGDVFTETHVMREPISRQA